MRETLEKARSLIEIPSSWTQGASARTHYGVPVPTQDPRARSWCSVGALWAMDGRSEDFELLEKAIRKLYPKGGECVSIFNDSHTHAEVLAVFDQAIAYAKNPESIHGDL